MIYRQRRFVPIEWELIDSVGRGEIDSVGKGGQQRKEAKVTAFVDLQCV